MDRMDDLLEGYLHRLESGEPLERVIASLPDEQTGLAPLLRTAARAREAQHPQLNPLKAQAQRRRLGSGDRPAGKTRLGWLLLPAGLGGLGALAFLIVLVGVLAFGAPAGAKAATLSNVQGVVEVASSSSAADWTVAVEGQRVRQGAAIRTRIGSTATLVFFDGSRAAIGPEASLVIEELSGGWDGSLRLLIHQMAGETHHQVVRLRGPDAFYKVLTPAGVAQVHGTAFQVDVSPQAGVRYVVDHGVVAVSQGDAVVTLTAGQTTLVQPDSSPVDPAFEFAVQGELTSLDGDVWVVGGLSIQVDPTLGAGFVVGDYVDVRGRILEDGAYVAERVGYADSEETELYFTGVIDEMGAGAWLVGGKTVVVDEQTEIDDGLMVGDPVGVSFVVLADGSWLARQIEALEPAEEMTPTPSPTAVDGTSTATPEETSTPEPSATPEMTGTPEASGTPEVTETPQMTATPLPTLSGDRAGCERTDWKHPEGRRLAERWGVSYEEIMSLFCRGYGFGEIDLAYELARQSGRTVEEVCAMRDAGMGWGNIKKEFGPQSTPAAEDSAATPAPDDHPHDNGKKPTQAADPHQNNNNKPTKEPNPHKKNP